MKATLIISSEYKYNQPSVFIFADGKYFGCQIYPSSRNFPQDVNYWSNATSSDSDRDFSLTSVEYSEEEFKLIESLQNSIFANENLIKQYPSYKSAPKFNVKRGKAYQDYLSFRATEDAIYAEITAYNAPYDKAVTAAKNELRKLLLSK